MHTAALKAARALAAEGKRVTLFDAAGRLKRYLAFRGWSEELAADLGLINPRGQEWYRGRLVVPETRGDAPRGIYLVGRIVPGVQGPSAPGT